MPVARRSVNGPANARPTRADASAPAPAGAFVSRSGVEAEPYYMLGAPTTGLTMTPNSLFIGGSDNYLYCLDRFTMRKKWAFATDQATRKQLAVELSRRAYDQVPYISFAQWINPVAYRSDRLSGVITVPSVPPMWNIEKK